MELSLQTRAEAAYMVVHCAGELDVFTAPQLRQQLLDLAAAGQHDVIVDLSEVRFLDSTGLGVLVSGLKRVRAHDGSLRLVCPQDRVLRLFQITGLSRVFDLHPDLAGALASTE
jgi:anti-sigma B factor antagonist